MLKDCILSAKTKILQLYGIFIVSIILRMLVIDRDVFIDEAFSYFYSKMPLSFMLAGNDTHSFLYYIFLKPFSILFGNNIVLLRLSSVFIWACLFFVLYYFISHRFSHKIAIYALLFMSLSPTMIYYSTELRMYILLLLFAVLNLICYFAWLDKPDAKSGVMYAIISTLLIYIHLFGALLLAPQAIYAIYKKVAPKQLFLAFGAIGLLFLPQAIITLNTYQAHQSFHYAETTIISLVSTYSYMLSPPSTAIILFFITIISIILLAAYYRISTMQYNIGFYYLCLLIPIPLWLASKWTGIYHHRLFLVMAIPLFIIIAVFTNEIRIHSKEKYEHLFIIAMFIAATVYTIMTSFSGAIFKTEMQEQVKYAETLPELPIIHETTITYLPYKFYHEGTGTQNLLTEPPDFTFGGSVVPKEDILSPEKLSVVNSTKRWVVVLDKNRREITGHHLSLASS